MNISVIGTGYVGLVTGACLAHLGMNVLCMDRVENKIAMLKNISIPIYEPGLEEIVRDTTLSGHLNFTSKIEKAVEFADAIFIAVGTPTLSDNIPDISSVIEVAREVAENMNTYKLIITKSTVPVGTGQSIKNEIKKVLIKSKKHIDFDIASNPEFLREGSAIKDFMKPDRIVVGVENQRAADIMKKIYSIHVSLEVPFLITSIETAEMIKYASNSFLASKISFINEIANMCELCNADIKTVSLAMGLDPRISSSFLNPGPGYGGSCFPKDTKAMLYIGKKIGYTPEIIKSTIKVNENQRLLTLKKIKNLLGDIKGKTITILGTAFKAGTDDIRESPAIYAIKSLIKEGCLIKVYDPKALENTKKELLGMENIQYCSDVYEAAVDSHCIIIFTEWQEFMNIDFLKLRNLVNSLIFLDLRNIYDPSVVRKYGFIYRGIGRK